MDASTSDAIATGTKAARRSPRPAGPAVSRHGRGPGPWTGAWDGRAGDAAAVGLPAVLALALCLVGVTSRSLGFDESATATIVVQHGAALSSAIAHDGGNMSGYYVLMHALVSLFGRGVLVLRAPSALAVAATVALTGALGL